MANSAETLARELADVRRRLAALERGTQLQSSTLGTSSGVVSVVHGLEAGISAGAAAAEALQKAVTAQATADGAVHTYFGDTEPGNASFGDLWRATDGTVKQYDGEDWQDISDPQVAADVEEALDRIAHAEEALDGKITTYFRQSSNDPANDPDVVLNLGDLWIVSDGGNLIRRWNGTAWVDAPAGSAALADRAVTSTKLETDLVLTSRVIAGQLNARHAEMNPDGFSVYNGERTVARLGYADSDDYFVVADSNSNPGASITASGVMSGSQINATGIYYNGADLESVLESRPRGVVAWGQRVTGNTNQTAGYQRPFLRVDAILYPGRLYKIWTSNVITCVSQNNNMVLSLFHKIGEQCTVQNGTQLMATRAYHDFGHSELQVLYTLPSTYTEPTAVSFLLAQYVASGTAYLKGEDARPAQLAVEDMGNKSIPNGINTLNTSGDRAALACGSVLTAYPTATYYYGIGSEGVFKGNTYRSGYVGIQSQRENYTALFFADLTPALSGHTIQSARVYLPMREWERDEDNIGVAVHSWATTDVAPNNVSDIRNAFPMTQVTEATDVPAPGARWIDLPSSVLAGFVTGANRGIVFQRPESRQSPNDALYYGKIAGSDMRLEITYI